MNFNLSQIPERNTKPRDHGITMVMDKGLSVDEAKNFMSVAKPHVDMVKLGFGTSFVTPNLKEKLASNLSSMQNEVRKVTRISTHKLQPTPRRRTTSKNIHK